MDNNTIHQWERVPRPVPDAHEGFAGAGVHLPEDHPHGIACGRTCAGPPGPPGAAPGVGLVLAADQARSWRRGPGPPAREDEDGVGSSPSQPSSVRPRMSPTRILRTTRIPGRAAPPRPSRGPREPRRPVAGGVCTQATRAARKGSQGGRCQPGSPWGPRTRIPGARGRSSGPGACAAPGPRGGWLPPGGRDQDPPGAARPKAARDRACRTPRNQKARRQAQEGRARRA